MSWETYNSVTGTTRNPYDTRKTSGGSSGGEAALLSAGASLLSLSSDIAGSARLPAMFCGVFGHKPTPDWVSTNGHVPDCDDKNWSSLFSIAPMARYASDLPVLLKIIAQPDVPVLRLDEKISLLDLKIFYMEDDGHCCLTGPVDREIKDGIRKVIKHLDTNHGIKVQKADIKELKYAFEISIAMLLQLDGVETIFMKGTNPREWKSVFIEVLKYLCFMSPHMFTTILYGVLKRIHEKFPKSMLNEISEKGNSLKQRFQELLGDNGALLYPTFTSPANCHYEIYPNAINTTYMMIFNALGLPVTQCPIGLNRNGLPIGIQVIGNSGNDNLTIGLAREIEKAFGGWQPPPSYEKVI